MIESLVVDRLIAQVERRTKAEHEHAITQKDRDTAKFGLIGLKDECERLKQTRDRLVHDNKSLEDRAAKMSRALDALREAAQAYLECAKGRSKSGLTSALIHKIGEAEKLSDSYIPF